jgi:hypothetical protein
MLLALPPALRKVAAALFDQQMWCWGCDIRREGGNLLAAYGFHKHASDKKNCHSTYTFALDSDCTMTLWGWGMWISRAEMGSAFVSRSRFDLQHTYEVVNPIGACQASDLPFTTLTTSAQVELGRALLCEAMLLCADYERWLIQSVGLSYREQVVKAHPPSSHHKPVEAHRMADTWHELVHALQSYEVSEVA